MDNYTSLKMYQNTLEKILGFSWGDFIEELPEESLETVSELLGYITEELIKLDSSDPKENIDHVSGLVEEYLWTGDSDQTYWLGRIQQRIIDGSPNRFKNHFY